MVWLGFAPNTQPAYYEREEEDPSGGDSIRIIPRILIFRKCGVQYRQDHGGDDQNKVYDEGDCASSSFPRGNGEVAPEVVILWEDNERVKKRRTMGYVDGNVVKSR